MRLGTKTDGKEGESSPLFRKCRGFTSVENSKHRILCCVNIMKVYSFGTSGDGTMDLGGISGWAATMGPAVQECCGHQEGVCVEET